MYSNYAYLIIYYYNLKLQHLYKTSHEKNIKKKKRIKCIILCLFYIFILLYATIFNLRKIIY